MPSLNIRPDRLKHPGRVLASAGIAAAFSLSLLGCRGEPVVPEKRARPVTVMTMAESQPGDGLGLPGRVESFAAEEIAAEVTGRLTFVAEEGQRLVGRYVEDDRVLVEGDVLARIDDSDLQLVREAAESDLERARTQRDAVAPASIAEAEAELERREIELERVREAESRNAVSPMEVTSAVTAVRVATARVDAAKAAEIEAATAVRSAEAALASVERDLEKCIIRAPFNGLVDERHLVAGGFVGVGSPVARMVMMDPVRIAVSVSAATAQQIELEDPVMIHVPGRDEPQMGKVFQRSVSADQETGTYVITVVARNAFVRESLSDGVKAIGTVSAALRRDPLDATSTFFVEENRVLRRDAAGWYVWAMDEVGLRDGRDTFRLRRVNVTPTEERINFQGAFVGRFLSSDDVFDEDIALAGDPPEDAAEGDLVQVQAGQWRMQPGSFVTASFIRVSSTRGFYVPIDSIVFDADGSASLLVAESGVVRTLAVAVHDVVGNEQRVESLDASVSLDGLSLITDGVHTLVDGEAIAVIGQGS